MVIFDCDGVLVDSEPIANRVMASFLSEQGYPVTQAECEARFIGRPLQDIIDEARSFGATIRDDWREEFYARQSRALAGGVPLINGVIGVIDQLDDAGIASAIVSNGRFAKMQLTLGPHGLWDRFAGRIYSPEHHGRPKPHPDMFLRAANDLGVEPKDCVVIDDSPSGVNGAIAANMRCIGYAEHTPLAKLNDLGVEIAKDMVDVASLLGISSQS